MSLKLRMPKIGDTVTIHSILCEWHKVSGEIIGISDRPDDDMPYMVRRWNYDTWPFALYELELHGDSDDADAYIDGWVDPYLTEVAGGRIELL